MIKLYYTSKKGENEVQTRPDLSLGGYKSSTLIPNNSVNNLFSDISVYSVVKGQSEFIGIMAKNESSNPVINLRFWFDFPVGCQRKIEVAAVDLTEDGQIEGIENPYQQPYYAEFHEADGEGSAVDLGGIGAGQSIGIWLKSSINKENIVDEFSVNKIISGGNPQKSDEDVNLVFEWD